jgi:hypothetical protein
MFFSNSICCKLNYCKWLRWLFDGYVQSRWLLWSLTAYCCATWWNFNYVAGVPTSCQNYNISGGGGGVIKLRKLLISRKKWKHIIGPREKFSTRFSKSFGIKEKWRFQQLLNGVKMLKRQNLVKMKKFKWFKNKLICLIKMFTFAI